MSSYQEFAKIRDRNYSPKEIKEMEKEADEIFWHLDVAFAVKDAKNHSKNVPFDWDFPEPPDISL